MDNIPGHIDFHLSIHWDSGQAQTPLILVHGFTGSSRSWDSILDQLQYPTITIDLPGHGQTRIPAMDSGLSFVGIVDEMKATVGHCCPGKVHLGGYSLGGRLALALAIRHPQKIESLILESASPGIADERERRKRAIADGELSIRIETDFKRFQSDWSELTFFQNQKIRNLSAWRNQQIIRSSNSPEGLAKALAIMGTGNQPSYWDQLGELTLPVLLISGSEDEKFCRIARGMKERLVHAEHIVIPEAGHAPHIDRPDRFVNELIRWLENFNR